MAHFFGGGFPGFGFGGGDEMDEEKEVDNEEFYKLLNVEKTATPQEIKKAYRNIAKKAHPDKGGDPEVFKEINMAYEVLSNEDKRSTYDKYGKDGLKDGGGPSGFEDIFGGFFGGGGGRGGRRGGDQGARKTKPIQKVVQVKLEDVYQGKVVNLNINKRVCCEACGGKGGKNIKTCPDCKGQGFKVKTQMLGPGMIQQSQVPCNACRGEGQLFDEKDKCQVCKGEKIKSVDKNLEIPVDRGTPDEKVITFAGEGNEVPGAMAGDLMVIIKIKDHPIYKRKGADLYINKKISLLEALTGVNFKLKHLDGSEFTVCSAPADIIPAGSKKTVQGKGMPFYQDSMSHGNLIINFEVEFPKAGSLKKDNIEGLKKLLPGPKVPAPPKDYEMLEDFHEGHINENAEGGAGRQQYEEDHHQGGGQRVECGNQ